MKKRMVMFGWRFGMMVLGCACSDNTAGRSPDTDPDSETGHTGGSNPDSDRDSDTEHATATDSGPSTDDDSDAIGTAPLIHGFFVQPQLGYGATSYNAFNTQKEYSDWVQRMADVGTEMLFYQWTVHYQHEQTWYSAVWGGDASADFAFYDAAPSPIEGISVRSWTAPTDWPGTPSQGGAEPIDYLLAAGTQAGVEIWLGLYLNESAQSFNWWDAVNDNVLSQRDRDIIGYHRRRSVLVLQELCEKYGDHPALGGFYLSVEIANLGFMNEASWPVLAELLGDVADAAHNCGRPLAISPFFNVALSSPDAYAQMWDHLLQHTGLDIVILQDGVGVEPELLNETADKISPWFAALSQTVRKNGRQFWGNAELFTNEGSRQSPQFRPSSMSKIRRQLETVAPFVDRFVCFEFHYMDPAESFSFTPPLDGDAAIDANLRRQLYEDYRDYRRSAPVP